jgi:nitroreductase
MSGAYAQSVKLPAPQAQGGVPVLEAIENRASAVGASFPTGAVSAEELSTLLWAASGRNRAGKGWTVPTAMAKDPYVTIYVVGKDGTFTYNGKEHALEPVVTDDLRGKISGQGFVASASHVLVFVSRDTDQGKRFGQVLVGAMTQNIYLAAEGLNVGVRYMATMNQDFVRNTFKLAADDVAVCIMPIGHK